METVDDYIYSMLFNIQAPSIGLFIKDARNHFQRTHSQLYTSTLDMVIRPDKEPYDKPATLADDYNEIGLWIPVDKDTCDTDVAFDGVLLTWVDSIYKDPSYVQLVYLAPNGHMTMLKEPVPYAHLKDKTLSEVINQVIY